METQFKVVNPRTKSSNIKNKVVYVFIAILALLVFGLPMYEATNKNHYVPFSVGVCVAVSVVAIISAGFSRSDKRILFIVVGICGILMGAMIFLGIKYL